VGALCGGSEDQNVDKNVDSKNCALELSDRREIHAAVRVKPKLQWRPQDVMDSRNMEHLLRKATAKEWS
jgi:hypothetical protein